jgi:hypothetical protein
MTINKQQARRLAAAHYIRNARAIRREDAYASHVTDAIKDGVLKEQIETAREIVLGKHDHAFWCGQLIEYKTNGNSIALLP